MMNAATRKQKTNMGRLKRDYLNSHSTFALVLHNINCNNCRYYISLNLTHRHTQLQQTLHFKLRPPAHVILQAERQVNDSMLLVDGGGEGHEINSTVFDGIPWT